MEENKSKKFNVTTFLLIVAILVIIVMGVFIYILYTGKAEEVKKCDELQTKVEELNGSISESQTSATDTSKNEVAVNYNTNFSESVSKILGNGNTLHIELYGVDTNRYSGVLNVNNKHEAYIRLENFSEYSTEKKIADNVVNAWHCREGQSVGNSYILFQKEDGSVTYVRFRLTNGTVNFESEEKVLNGVTNLSNVVTISGNAAEGIGGIGVLLIKEDGTSLPLTTLDELAE